MATLSDIAKVVGVSDVTVSRVLNGGADYRRPTYAKRAQRIHTVARELGYRPNASAMAIRSGSFNTFALLLSADRTWSMLPDQLLAGIRDGLTARDRHLLVETMSDSVLTSSAAMPKLLRELASDGLLINYNANIPPRMVELIDSFHLPCVWINSKQPHDAVHPDDFGAAVQATKMLLQRGHQRISFVDHGNEDNPGHYSGVDRFAGYARTMSDAGLSGRRVGHPEQRRDGSMIPRLSAALTGADRPTALLGYSDLDARAVQMAAGINGLRLGENVSLITFHDRLLSDLGQSVATMMLPEKEEGLAAVEMLVRKVAHPEDQLPSRALPFAFEPGETLCDASP